jgi:hypothetical protein
LAATKAAAESQGADASMTMKYFTARIQARVSVSWYLPSPMPRWARKRSSGCFIRSAAASAGCSQR